MRKAWTQPTLEVLDISMTLAGTNYVNFDGNFTDGSPIPTDDDGNPLIGES
ncbi:MULTISPECIES: paeninodin family lasso peptide [Amphibacillus]|uniref:paeninodin family lasso peptide n=1 Tax=Amphibacillus TaxID=29331 RepID=UPI0003172E04|nr:MULTISPECIES: paeninodin family lasso peptide [Amphibacillus]MBM7540685.1 hypothetical protein [Amphibacillus cookii]